ncbi:DUF2167 domain-containing protein [Lewinella sp. IMCC34183]|uniref:DUF2167 domain-containing protein n=1 Tax=Lewinella sp. IMCC34183 TaxID=2248762 RepID=UPI00130074D1|nr:DUF2167 domain-containing protein [Lewinella sp. IMCC34183]
MPHLYPTAAALLLPFLLAAQAVAPPPPPTAQPPRYIDRADSLENGLTYHNDTTVALAGGRAKLTVPTGYRYLDTRDAATVLVDLWGNPPVAAGGSLGLLVPDGVSVSHPACYAIHLLYTEDGHVRDADASDIDYGTLLQRLEEEVTAENAARAAAGFGPVQLIGWAVPPHYDPAGHHLHWAKELYFAGEDNYTVNYNVRFLSRRGYLTMSIVGRMKDLPRINSHLDDLLASVRFTPGERYADFDPSTDKEAEYGLVRLVSGADSGGDGLLATLAWFFSGWKLAVIGLIGIGVSLRSLIAPKTPF